jgi:electron transfer flavoprotein beta subunit
MKILVCLKPVADPVFVHFNVETGELSALDRKLNKYDFYGIQEATALKEESGAHVSAVCITPPEEEEFLKKAFILGVDKVFRIWDPILGKAGYLDSRQKADLLARFIEKDTYDLIFCGTKSEDWNSGFFGACLSEQLGHPFVSGVVTLENHPESKSVVVHKKMEKGWMESFELKLPAVIATEHSKCKPKYLSPLKREITVTNFSDLGIEKPTSPLIQVLKVTEIRPRMKALQLTNKLSLTEKLKLVTGDLGKKKAEIAEVSGEKGAQIVLEKIQNLLHSSH